MKSTISLTGQAAMLALLLVGGTSCDLLNQESPQAFNPSDVFSTPGRIDKAAVGMYDALQDGEFLGSKALVYSDVRSDDVDLSGSFQQLATSTIQASDGNAVGAWAGGYRTMYMSNYMIRELTRRNGAGLTPEKYQQYIAEAKFIRALCHFTLVNLFAQPYNYSPDASHLGVPIQLEAPDGTEAYEAGQLKARATVKQVYDQIIQDLKDAIDGLPEVQGSGNINVARATKDAARGLLSRVYLYKGDNANAALYAGQIIASNRHQLNTTAYAEFRVPAGTEFSPTSETIFSIAMSQNDNPNTNAAIGQYYAPNSGQITVTPYRNALPGPSSNTNQPYTTTDRRRVDLLVYRTSKWWTRKYTSELATGGAGGSNRGAWIPIVRYPEILLNQAEALVKQSNGMPTDTVALGYLNMVRERSKPTTFPRYRLSSFANKEAFITAILTERRFELAFEGHRLYDLFRNGLNVPAHGTTTVVPELRWKEPRAVLPIPAAELQRNPNLIQNEGY